jgi:D-glycero-D-manno-heptose 1,7-bisphosphate phosphatase
MDDNCYLTTENIWLEIRTEPGTDTIPALFLDRDGTLMEDCGYISDPDAVRLLPGAAALVRKANRSGVSVAVVTNQSGIDRGLFSWQDFAAVQARLDTLLAEEDARIDAVAACPFHPDFTPGYAADQDRWRKPNAAMVTALATRLKLDCFRSWLVGDGARDIEAARGAGLAGGIQLLTKDEVTKTASTEMETPAFRGKKATDMAAATAILSQAGLFDAA